MKSPSYHVQEVDLTIDPNLEDIDIGRSALDFEVDEAPQYNQKLEVLEVETEINLDFRCYDDDLGESRGESDDQVGEAKVEVKVVIDGDESEFQDYLRTWEEEGYRNVDWDFRYHIESGYLTEVISPLAHLVDDSFRGVLPGVAFTDPPELTSGISEEKVDLINNEIEKQIHSLILDHLRENIEEEISEEEVVVEADIKQSSVGIYVGEYEDQLDDEEVGDLAERVTKSTKEVISEAIDENYQIDTPAIKISDELGPSEA